MTVHHAFFRPATRPAPILFPVGSLDDLLWERATCLTIGYHGINDTRHPYATCARQLRWSSRLNAKIAQVVS